MHDKNGVGLSVLEQCRILKLPRATYYERRRFEAERQKKKAGENKTRLNRAKIVINEWSTHSTYCYKKMSKHLKRLGYDWAGEKFIRTCTRNLESKARSLSSRPQEAEKRHTESSRTSCGTSSSRSRTRSWRQTSLTSRLHGA